MRYQYDLIIIGGGLAGSTLAKTMAEHGANVLVLERTKAFTDRVRGEQIHPWGVAEMKELGVYNLLEATCGHQLPWWDSYANGEFTRRRDLPATTPQNAPEFAFYHPAMQDVLIQAASDAGAEVRRGAVVTQVQRNQHPTVTIQQDGQTQTITAGSW
ncbi:MAG: FAD-dependent monooxygenase [Caldilineaceae bacterium]